MAKAPTDYSKGKIYKIVSDQTDKIYIGSTTKQYLSQRLSNHQRTYKCFQNGKYHYVTSFEIVKYDDAQIILIELFPCGTKDELLSRERFHLEQNKNCINKVIPKRTKKEILKACNNKHKEDRLAYRREYNKSNIYTCDCGATLTKHHKARHEKSNNHIKYISESSS